MDFKIGDEVREKNENDGSIWIIEKILSNGRYRMTEKGNAKHWLWAPKYHLELVSPLGEFQLGNIISTEETKVSVSISWQEAYEQNKTRDKCVLCGNKTVPKALFSSTINTCQCVDDLARG